MALGGSPRVHKLWLERKLNFTLIRSVPTW